MAEEEQTPPKSGSMKLIIIAGALLLFIAGGAGGYLLLGGKEASADAAATAEAEPEEEMPLAKSVYVSLNPEFVINFRDRNARSKFLKAELSVATTEEEVAEAVELHMPAIRNAMVLLLSRQIYEDLIPHEGKEALRQQALADVQSLLEERIGKPGIDDLYFNNFVMH